MSNSTTLLDTISSTQANKEVVVNALVDAESPAALWGRHDSTSSGLTWGYYGGPYGGNAIANGTLTLTASTTNYVYADNVTGAVSVNTTGVPTGKIPLYTIVTGTSTVTSYTDNRSYAPYAVVPAPGNTPYDMLMYFPGVPANSAIMGRAIIPRAVTMNSGASGYASAEVAATASTTLTITRNGTSIGTVTFAAASTTGTVSITSTVTTAAGDIIRIVNQGTADATLASISVTLTGLR